MSGSQFSKVCYWTEQREEHVRLRNLKTGTIGYSFGCTNEGNTIQVKLENGELDSWEKGECTEVREMNH